MKKIEFQIIHCETFMNLMNHMSNLYFSFLSTHAPKILKYLQFLKKW